MESYRACDGAPTDREPRRNEGQVRQGVGPLGDPRGLAYLEQALVELDPATQTTALALATAMKGRYHHYRTEHRKAIESLERVLACWPSRSTSPNADDIYTFLAGAHQHLLDERSDHWARTTMLLGERKRYPPAIAGGAEFLAENAAGRGMWAEALAYRAAEHASAGTKSGSLARVAWAELRPGVQALHGKGQLAGGAARSALVGAGKLCEQIGEKRPADLARS